MKIILKLSSNFKLARYASSKIFFSTSKNQYNNKCNIVCLNGNVHSRLLSLSNNMPPIKISQNLIIAHSRINTHLVGIKTDPNHRLTKTLTHLLFLKGSKKLKQLHCKIDHCGLKGLEC